MFLPLSYSSLTHIIINAIEHFLTYFMNAIIDSPQLLWRIVQNACLGFGQTKTKDDLHSMREYFDISSRHSSKFIFWYENLVPPPSNQKSNDQQIWMNMNMFWVVTPVYCRKLLLVKFLLSFTELVPLLHSLSSMYQFPKWQESTGLSWASIW